VLLKKYISKNFGALWPHQPPRPGGACFSLPAKSPGDPATRRRCRAAAPRCACPPPLAKANAEFCVPALLRLIAPKLELCGIRWPAKRAWKEENDMPNGKKSWVRFEIRPEDMEAVKIDLLPPGEIEYFTFPAGSVTVKIAPPIPVTEPGEVAQPSSGVPNPRRRCRRSAPSPRSDTMSCCVSRTAPPRRSSTQ
jgi:hypothetical protein